MNIYNQNLRMDQEIQRIDLGLDTEPGYIDTR